MARMSKKERQGLTRLLVLAAVGVAVFVGLRARAAPPPESDRGDQEGGGTLSREGTTAIDILEDVGRRISNLFRKRENRVPKR